MTNDDEMPFIRGARAMGGVNVTPMAGIIAAAAAASSGDDDDGGGGADSSSAATGEPNFEFLWEEYQKRMESQREWEENGVDIHPDYGFVAKTRETKSRKKVFLNIVASPLLSAPVEEPVPGQRDQMRVRIPMSCEGPFADTDKEGGDCNVFDVVFNPECVDKCKEDTEFRDFVVGVSIENIRNKTALDLDQAVTYPKLRYKGDGPPRVQHIKKSGLLKKPLVELVDDAEDERQERERAAELARQKSEFKLNFDEMYNRPKKGAASASAKAAVPSVASLLAQNSKPTAAVAGSAQAPSSAQSATSVAAATATTAAASAATTALPTVVARSSVASLASPVSPSTAASFVRDAHAAWSQAGVTCQLQCTSLRAIGGGGGDDLIAFDASEWDDDVWPDALALSVHMPAVNRIADVEVDISADDVLVRRADACTTEALAHLHVRVPFPYAVDEAASSAKFDKRRHVLQMRMPVVGRLTAAAAAAYASAIQERQATSSCVNVSTAAIAAPVAGDAYELVVLRAVQSALHVPVHFTSPLVFRLV